MRVPGHEIRMWAETHAAMDQLPAGKVNAFTTPATMRPQGMAQHRAI